MMNDPILLIGKPNAGKSSLFNLITGLNQKIANYSGATVAQKSGKFLNRTVIDLPGLKSLLSTSPEEKIAKASLLEFAVSSTPIIFVANGMTLKDNLSLFTEVADLQLPSILVINFKDDLVKNKVVIDIDQLEKTLSCPVVMMNSKTGEGLDELKALIKNNSFEIPNAYCRSSFESISDNAVANTYIEYIASNDTRSESEVQSQYNKRKQLVNAIVEKHISEPSKFDFLENTKKVDKILLHPIFGSLIFLFVMLLVFQSVFSFAGTPMDWIDAGFANLSSYAKEVIPIEWLASLVADGILAGIGGVLIFIPQIAILFFLLGVLEHSGYLSRISFISDRFLRKFGLSGKSVIPLMSSWACAIPAIMSARMIDDPKERMAVILASPLMTCSARLPVYTILIAILIPSTSKFGIFNLQGLSLLGLYLIGLVSTLIVSWFIHKKSSIKSNQLWSLEMPVYRVPHWRNVIYNTYLKTKSFVVEAGKIIFLISIVLWFLASFSPKSDGFIEAKYQEHLAQKNNEITLTKEAFDLEYSYAGYMGKFIEPVIAPLGYDWKIGIALITSFAAREVFVGTLSTIYSIGSEEESTIVNRLKNEKNIQTGQPRYNIATTMSLLIFYVFALQCMSTIAIVKKETGKWSYAIAQFVFMTLAAYVFAFLVSVAF